MEKSHNYTMEIETVESTQESLNQKKFRSTC